MWLLGAYLSITNQCYFNSMWTARCRLEPCGNKGREGNPATNSPYRTPQEGLQSSYVARVLQNCGDHTLRTGAHPKPALRVGGRQEGGRYGGWHKYALRPMGSNGCGSWCHAPPQAAVTNTFNRRSGWHCVENTIKVSAVRNSSHRCTRGVIFFGLIEAFQCLVLAKWLNK